MFAIKKKNYILFMKNASFEQKNIANNNIQKLFNHLKEIEQSGNSISELNFAEILGCTVSSCNFNEKLSAPEYTSLISLMFNKETICNVSYNNDKTAISFISKDAQKQLKHCFYIGKNGIYYTNNEGLIKAHFSESINEENSITCCGFNLKTCCGDCFSKCC